MRQALMRKFDSKDPRAGETKRAISGPILATVTGEFEGYASVFNLADLGRDVVLPGAFRESLARKNPASIKMLWQHEAAQPVGVWLAIHEDHHGLKVRGRLNLEVARAREIYALMNDGAVDGLSIGFRTLKAVRDRQSGLRHLAKIDLWEISIVTFPMLPQARVEAVKRESSKSGGFFPRDANAGREVTRALQRAAHILL